MTDARTYQREYARKQRDAAWAAQAMHKTLCPRLLARGKPCRAPLESRFVDGATVPFCPQCDRKRRGICIDCRTEPVVGTVGKALRCGACAKIERLAAGDRYKQRHPSRLKKEWLRRKAALEQNPEAHREVLERKRLWRQARPERVAAQKKADALKHADRVAAYHREYRARHAEKKRAYARAKYYEQHPERPTPVCRVCSEPIAWGGRGRPPVLCLAHVPPSTASRRHRNAPQDRNPNRKPSELPPLPVRTCLLCPTPMAGRARICAPCRTSRRRTARETLSRLSSPAPQAPHPQC
jgi:hypothetical protein